MSFYLSPVNPNTERIQKIQRIYIDPEQLIALKTKRKTFAMVPSIFQPPQDELHIDEQSSWNKSKGYSLVNQKTISYLTKKNQMFKPMLPNDKQIFPQQKIKLLQDILDGQTILPNVQFIWKLLPYAYNKQIANFQEGDCISLKNCNEEKYLILSGQVRIVGTNDHQYKRKAGYFFFVSNQSFSKIKQIVVLRSTKLLKIPNHIYQSLIKNYLYLKNCQKIKFIQYCPFFIWKYQLSQDLASCMEIKITQKEQIIYQANSVPDCIYFVREGIVLLQRNTKIMNPVVEDYEKHYEKNQVSEKDTILVVRKGMAFGIDGIIIKQFTNSVFSNLQLEKAMFEDSLPQNNIHSFPKQLQDSKTYDIQNPQTQISSKKAPRKNLRIYSAKTLGKCELYCLDRRVLQTLFTLSDINQDFSIKKKQIAAEELERMSKQYTNIFLNNIDPKVAQISLRKKELILKVQERQLPKSKSVALLGNREILLQQKNQKLKNPQIGCLLSKKKPASLDNINAEQQKQLKTQFYLNQQKERNQLQNRIRAQRQRKKLNSIKKANDKNNSSFKKDEKDIYTLPKLNANSKDRSGNSDLLRKNQRKQNQKLNDIINIKLKESIKDYPNSKLYQHQQSVTIVPQHSKQSELSKLLEENRSSKGNPSFINVKSYKSIISVYETTKKY